MQPTQSECTYRELMLGLEVRWTHVYLRRLTASYFTLYTSTRLLLQQADLHHISDGTQLAVLMFLLRMRVGLSSDNAYWPFTWCSAPLRCIAHSQSVCVRTTMMATMMMNGT